MKTKPFDAARVWKQLVDDVVPQLQMSVIDRAVYAFLLRHSRLEGKTQIRFSLAWLARGLRLSPGTARQSVHRLVHYGVLSLIECNKDGHVAQVRLPNEVRGVRITRISLARRTLSASLEEKDFFRTALARRAIHEREAGRCFYCLRRVVPRRRCLDHVVPRATLGRNSYRNLVSACETCNAKKRARPAEDFLRWLFRDRRLNPAELRNRFRALRALKAGKLKPQIDSRRLVRK